jgi:hypothetical protein
LPSWKQRMLQRTSSAHVAPRPFLIYAIVRMQNLRTTRMQKKPLLPGRCILTVDKTEVGNSRPLELLVQSPVLQRYIKEHRPQLAHQMVRQYGLWLG